jgi:hypothetical protein
MTWNDNVAYAKDGTGQLLPTESNEELGRSNFNQTQEKKSSQTALTLDAITSDTIGD